MIAFLNLKQWRFLIVLLVALPAILEQGSSLAQQTKSTFQYDQQTVGHFDGGETVTPINQILTPFGQTIDLPGMRPSDVAISPNGKLLAVSGTTSELLILSVEDGTVMQRVHFPRSSQRFPPKKTSENDSSIRGGGGQISYHGLIFSPLGGEIYVSNVNGYVMVFAVSADNVVEPSHVIALPVADAPRRKAEIPSGLATSTDGQLLYVCGNLSNRLYEIEIASGKVLRQFDTGVAPYEVVLAKEKAYVSNWGGRKPSIKDVVGPAGRGTTVKVDPITRIANDGTVTIIDLKSGIAQGELFTGLHASGLAVSPGEEHVVCANAASDTLSVISTDQNKVVATLWVKSTPADLFGASPNAVAFGRNGHRLYVANGTQNAIAVFDFEPHSPKTSRLMGLIPVGWFPGSVAVDGTKDRLFIANIKGFPRTPNKEVSANSTKLRTRQFQGTLSMFPVPGEKKLADLSEQVAVNLRRKHITNAFLTPREDQPPRAIPERIGEPSFIRHVVYIIKENRTYDQVFGDLPEGNGDASLCIFGEEITPNHHKLAKEFVLLDNTYCAGILSADGHQWSTTAFSTDYMEKSFAGFPRSYPDGMGDDDRDALAYSPAGFIWDIAVARGISIRNYGEFMVPRVKWRNPAETRGLEFMDCYQAWKEKTNRIEFKSEPAIASIDSFSPRQYVGWEMSVPDQYRADVFLEELQEFEKQGEFPQLVIICLPNDHTSGVRPRCPTPAACMADNDLAFGRIVEGLSKSRFWKNMAIFTIEDDPQDGWDHVSGYRTIAFCISPFAKRNEVVSTLYNSTSVLRTIGQILGMPPMNQFDASATPMFDCFINEPDFTPFSTLPNKIPLDQLNPDPNAVQDPVLRADIAASEAMNFREIDRAPEDQLNRILWRSVRGTLDPYPEWAIRMDDSDDD